MKFSKLLFIMMFVCCVSLNHLTVKADTTTGTVDMYRLYNPNSGEHFYTAQAGERNQLVSIGWAYEGIGWVAPTVGDDVYRLYNRNTGDHHYTLNVSERDYLIGQGWIYEGISWKSGGSLGLHRLYNPNAKAGSHHYTTSLAEANSLSTLSWLYEGISWYAVGEGYPDSSSVISQTSNDTNTSLPYYSSCSEARAAGKTSIKRGEPGYGAHLDHDGDGIACERSK